MSIVGRKAQMLPASRVWHNREARAAWLRLDMVERMLHAQHHLTAKGFEITTSYEYDPVNVQYMAVFALYQLPINPSYHSKPIFEHREPIETFPSDELITKIVMVVG